MDLVWVAGGGGILALLWLIVLTIFFWRNNQILRQVIPEVDDGDGKRSVLARFDQILDEVSGLHKREQMIQKTLKDITLEGLGHIQKVALSRYNPYGDTGGEQSFSLVLLNGKQNGIILTSLHTRSGTRVYAKTVKEGSSQIQLSKEEKALLEKTLNKL